VIGGSFRSDDVPSIRFNGRIRVPTVPLEAKLDMENAVTG
jgi:hypothetical protein